MYISKIKIENYGSIANFEFTPKFDNDGNPVPIVLIGKNGSGKSLLLANIVDALIEAKRQVYPQFIPEVKGTNYYKVGKKTYIKNGADFSNVLIEFQQDDIKYKYQDIMSRPLKLLQRAHLQFCFRLNQLHNTQFYR